MNVEKLSTERKMEIVCLKCASEGGHHVILQTIKKKATQNQLGSVRPTEMTSICPLFHYLGIFISLIL
jgi:hypothetical protein